MSDPTAAPKVAVLLCAFNGAKHLDEQLASLAAQEGVFVEVFARDDGSTDGTLEILAKHSDRWPSLVKPLGGEKLGPAQGFLGLLREAPEGFDLYAFCDQDDVWLPDKLSRAAKRLTHEKADEARLYCSRVICVDEMLRFRGPARLLGDSRFEHLLFENIAFGNTIVMNSAAAAVIRSRTPGDGLIMHDWWCALVISALGQVLYDPEPSVLYRQHGTNAVGASPSRLKELIGLSRRLLHDPSGFFPIRRQIAELLRLYGDRMKPRDKALAARILASRGSLVGQLDLAVRGPIIRSYMWDAIAVRALIVAGWY